jgi:membrane protease subunit HflK
MRRSGPPSEIRQLAAPVARLLDAAWQRMHWWVATMALLYLLSGITVVRSDEVAVILRWGRLVGDTPALREHGPGLLFAFPRPMDRVVHVQTKHIWELAVSTLANSDAAEAQPTLDPLTEGYALTGDQNIVHVDMVARYRVRDPAQWAFYGPKVEDVLRVEVTAAMVRSLGEMGIDRVLSDGRKDLIATATRRAQAGLDDAHSGLELSSLELTRLTPPLALANDFDAVQSAFIGAETKKKEAQAFAETAIPQAQAEADAAMQSARGSAESEMARAKGDGVAFVALDRQYRANPPVIRERLYRDAVEQALGAAGKVRWVPPPVNGHYQGFRITVQPVDAGSRPTESPSQSAAGAKQSAASPSTGEPEFQRIYPPRENTDRPEAPGATPPVGAREDED